MKPRFMSQYSLFYGPVTGLYTSRKKKIVNEDEGKVHGSQFPLLFHKFGFFNDLKEDRLDLKRCVAVIKTFRTKEIETHISTSR